MLTLPVPFSRVLGVTEYQLPIGEENEGDVQAYKVS